MLCSVGCVSAALEYTALQLVLPCPLAGLCQRACALSLVFAWLPLFLRVRTSLSLSLSLSLFIFLSFPLPLSLSVYPSLAFSRLLFHAIRNDLLAHVG